MIVTNGNYVLNDEYAPTYQLVLMGGTRAAHIHIAGLEGYKASPFGPTPKDLLAAALAKAGAVNRYLYNATTVGAFDTAFTATMVSFKSSAAGSVRSVISASY